MPRPVRSVANVALLLFVVTLVAPAALAQEAPAEPPALPVVEGSPGFDPGAFLGQGDAYNCAHFKSQAEAQAVLRADPSDPNRLDTDRPRPDGIACENNPPPFDQIPVPR